MSILQRLLGQEDPRHGLLASLRSMNLDWSGFRDRVLDTFALLGLKIPCDAFRHDPSAESMVATMDALLTTSPELAVEFRQVVRLAGLEQLVMETVQEADAEGTGRGYLYMHIALPKKIIAVFDALPEGNGSIAKNRWITAYFSACAGSSTMLPVDRACSLMALQYKQLGRF